MNQGPSSQSICFSKSTKWENLSADINTKIAPDAGSARSSCRSLGPIYQMKKNAWCSSIYWQDRHRIDTVSWVVQLVARRNICWKGSWYNMDNMVYRMLESITTRDNDRTKILWNICTDWIGAAIRDKVSIRERRHAMRREHVDHFILRWMILS